MCVISYGDSIPQKTHLTKLKVDESHELLVYKNSFTSRQKKENESCMMFAFPKDKSDREVYLFSKNALESFINFTEKTSNDTIKYEKTGIQCMGYSDNYVKIQNIGNYEISIVKSLEELDTKIHPMFKTDTYYKKIEVFNDKKLFPDYITWSYLIAKTTKNIENDYFGIMYTNTSGINYFPTCHELNDKYEYDVSIHYWENKKKIFFPFKLSDNSIGCRHIYQYNNVSNALYAIDMNTLITFHTECELKFVIKGISYDTNKKITLTTDGYFCLSTTTINCQEENQNIILKY